MLDTAPLYVFSQGDDSDLTLILVYRECLRYRFLSAIFTSAIFQGCSRVMKRPAGRIRRGVQHVKGWVGLGGVHNLTGRVGSGREVFKISRVGSDRVKSFSNLSGGFGSGQDFQISQVGSGGGGTLTVMTRDKRVTRGLGQHDPRVVFC